MKLTFVLMRQANVAESDLHRGLAMDGRESNTQIDPTFVLFLQTADEAEARLRLELVVDLAAPIIWKVTSWSRDPEDAFQETVQRLIEHLWDLRTDPGTRAITAIFITSKLWLLMSPKGSCGRSIRNAAAWWILSDMS